MKGQEGFVLTGRGEEMLRNVGPATHQGGRDMNEGSETARRLSSFLKNIDRNEKESTDSAGTGSLEKVNWQKQTQDPGTSKGCPAQTGSWGLRGIE